MLMTTFLVFDYWPCQLWHHSISIQKAQFLFQVHECHSITLLSVYLSCSYGIHLLPSEIRWEFGDLCAWHVST